jgi:peroxiredoxin
MNETGSPQPQQLGTLPEGVGIVVGQRAPDALLRDANNHAVQLRDLVATGPILLVFYRGGWCPYCNFQIHEMTVTFPELERRGVTPVAVSVDRVEESARTQATYTIPFPVLSDPDLAAHRAFRVVHHADEAEVERLRGFGLDIERASGRDHHDFAIPSIFVIDRDGIVRWAHADPDYRVRPTTAQILAAIDSLGIAAGAGRE